MSSSSPPTASPPLAVVQVHLAGEFRLRRITRLQGERTAAAVGVLAAAAAAVVAAVVVVEDEGALELVELVVVAVDLVELVDHERSAERLAAAAAGSRLAAEPLVEELLERRHRWQLRLLLLVLANEPMGAMSASAAPAERGSHTPAPTTPTLAAPVRESDDERRRRQQRLRRGAAERRAARGASRRRARGRGLMVP